MNFKQVFGLMIACVALSACSCDTKENSVSATMGGKLVETENYVNIDLMGRVFLSNSYRLVVFNDGTYQLSKKVSDASYNNMSASGLHCFTGRVSQVSYYKGNDANIVVPVFMEGGTALGCGIKEFSKGEISAENLPPDVVDKILDGYRIIGKRVDGI